MTTKSKTIGHVVVRISEHETVVSGYTREVITIISTNPYGKKFEAEYQATMSQIRATNAGALNEKYKVAKLVITE